jgi:hypothetical protein
MSRRRAGLRFMFADPAQHGGKGDTMGRPSRSTPEADRQGWAASDATEGFSRRRSKGGWRGRKD